VPNEFGREVVGLFGMWFTVPRTPLLAFTGSTAALITPDLITLGNAFEWEG